VREGLPGGRLALSWLSLRHFVKARLMFRVAWGRRWRFSIKATRTHPFPSGPKPMPGETATSASSISLAAQLVDPSRVRGVTRRARA